MEQKNDDNKLQILLVDDDQIYQFAAGRIIQATGLAGKVIMYPDGESALGYLKQADKRGERLPDVIFLDLNMPGMNGWQFLDAYDVIKNDLAKSIPVYIMSSSTDLFDTSRAKQYSIVKNYLVKPLSKEKFHQALSSLLAVH